MEQTGINPKKIKFFNDTALLYLLCSEGALSRKQIASKLGLTAAAVSKISKRLIDSGKIKEMGISAENSDRAGRKEVLLALKSDDKISFEIFTIIRTIRTAWTPDGGIQRVILANVVVKTSGKEILFRVVEGVIKRMVRITGYIAVRYYRFRRAKKS